ncbi:MAG TPA: hypothetical protein VJU59_33625 [Paraburkholderia sp.]|uniref:hypothetical protein n=1 Tax=Paraburkholderia sp. TaxID=1926495 RepID=UPI002B468F04|nr:hypothetical protein [Paraburkholderia sp.]HKR44559.1 hypothetical protein [Paraburkholderia sp.]
MAQVDNYQVPAHPTGLDMRIQLNAIILALIGDNAGPTEPAEVYPGMWWGNTASGRLMRRRNDNTGWVDIGPLDDPLQDIRNAVNTANNSLAGKVNRSGDAMQGDLWFGRVDSDWTVGWPLIFGAGGSNERNMLVRYSYHAQGNGGLEFLNAGRWAVNTLMGDDGTFRVRESIQLGYRCSLGAMPLGAVGTGYGEIELRSADGTWCRMRGRGSGGGMQWVNHGYNAVIGEMDDGGSYSNLGEMRMRWGAAWVSDGNLYMPWAGNWLSNVIGDINNRIGGLGGAFATRNAECQHNSGLGEFGRIVQGSSGHGEVTCPGPWVMVGLRGASWETWARGIVLRNN